MTAAPAGGYYVVVFVNYFEHQSNSLNINPSNNLLSEGRGFYYKQNIPKALVALRNTSESYKRKKEKVAIKGKLLI